MEKEEDRKEWTFKSQRLPQRDYGQKGAYFVTICAYQRRPCFKTPALEKILKQQWQELPQRFPSTSLDRFVIMPDHLHFIVWIDEQTPSSPTLPQIVGAYKSLSAVAWLRHLKETGSEVIRTAQDPSLRSTHPSISLPDRKCVLETRIIALPPLSLSSPTIPTCVTVVPCNDVSWYRKG